MPLHAEPRGLHHLRRHRRRRHRLALRQGAGDAAEIAAAAIEAAQAGAAVAHIHVRDPETGKGARDPKLYREVVERIRDSRRRRGAEPHRRHGRRPRARLGRGALPADPDGTDMAGATERLVHVAELLPEICTLDCGTMNFGEGDYVMTNTPAMLKAMARQIQALGVRPEIEVFDTGHLLLAQWLKAQGVIDDPVMIQLCMGIPWGAPDDIGTFMAIVDNVPGGLDLLGLLDRPQPAALRGARGACRRQRPRRARGQPLARQGRARHQRRAGRARRRHRAGHGRAAS